jgi:hypothetical protein
VEFAAERISRVSMRMTADDACVTGQGERNHANVGMYRLRPKQNGFRFFNAFGASKPEAPFR